MRADFEQAAWAGGGVWAVFHRGGAGYSHAHALEEGRRCYGFQEDGVCVEDGTGAQAQQARA